MRASKVTARPVIVILAFPMPQHIIRISTGSRLHFGMFSFGHGFEPGAPRQFGGVGMMVAEPGIRLTVRSGERMGTGSEPKERGVHVNAGREVPVPILSPAPQLEATGPLADRAIGLVRRAAAALSLPAIPQCSIQIETAPREHIGLGTGTQLGMAIATAIHILAGRPLGLPGELAATVGRGQRSAIGSHGFAVGGVLLEAGKRRAEEISALVARMELPAAWRILLLIPRKSTGLFGDAERQAFARLPPVPRETTAALCTEALLHLLPAAAKADFEAFSASLYRFGEMAGNCFAAQQQGTFFDCHAAQLAARMRQLGVEGVGQTSWGPTLFAMLPNQQTGQEIANRIRVEADSADYDCVLTAPENHGATVNVE